MVQSVDVVIPTYNRAGDLRLTLNSLAGMQIPSGLILRVLVVDNNSPDDTQAVVASLVASVPFRLLSVVESRQGLCFARNAGIESSTAELVAFLDDDVNVSPQWLNCMVAAFEETNCAAVGGRAHLLYPGERPCWITQQDEINLSCVELGDHRIETDHSRVFGLNMAVRREWFDRIGMFRTDLDRVGSSLLSGGETELLKRISDYGGVIVYEPGAFLWHRVPESRLSKAWLENRHYWGVRSGIRLYGHADGTVASTFVCCLTVAQSLASYYWRCVRNGSASAEAAERETWVVSARAELDEALHEMRYKRNKSI